MVHQRPIKPPDILERTPLASATLYSLIYGIKAVMPLEVEIRSLRILKDAELDELE
jgi:hypothetical protein